MRSANLDTRSRELFDRGFRDLESRFDPEVGLVSSPFQPDRHQPHPSIWFAHCLLIRNGEGDAALAEQTISRALSLQEHREGDPHAGNFRWFLEDEVVSDLNACQFVLEALVHLLLRAGDRLSGETNECILESMKFAFGEAERLDVNWTYTNIHLLDVQNSILGGQLLNDDVLRARGQKRLMQWSERTKETGVPHEFNSPTYSAVQINVLAAIAQLAEDEAIGKLARDGAIRLAACRAILARADDAARRAAFAGLPAGRDWRVRLFKGRAVRAPRRLSVARQDPLLRRAGQRGRSDGRSYRVPLSAGRGADVPGAGNARRV